VSPREQTNGTVVIEYQKDDDIEKGALKILHSLIGHRADAGLLVNKHNLAVFWDDKSGEAYKIHKFPKAGFMKAVSDVELLNVMYHIGMLIAEVQSESLHSFMEQEPSPVRKDNDCLLRPIDFVCKDGSLFRCYRYTEIVASNS
jgi:hypothetical protein